jgi:FkbM family methyltransferase
MDYLGGILMAEILNGFTLSDWKSRSRIVHEFVHESSRPKYVFGCNQLAKRIGELIDLAGFIDDKIIAHSFAGKPVIRSHQVPTDAIIVSAIIGVLPVTVEQHLHSLTVDHVDYFAFAKLSELDLAPIPFWEGAHEDMQINAGRYEAIKGRMGSVTSRKTIDDLMSFRGQMDLAHMSSYQNRQDQQYFEDFLRLERDGLNFFDLGCFDGFTSSEFARLSPRYSSINAFEPMPRLFNNCRENLKHLRDCAVHNFGASDLSQSLLFTDNGSSSTASTSAGVLVDLKRLDDLELPLPDLIKIDVEGAELDALRGMSHLIQEAQPMMAVACYHYPNEILEIVEFWDSLSLDGTLEIRHYTEGTTETVIFFIPKNHQ